MTNRKFHSGELLVQARAGEERIAARNSAAISGEVPPAARSFVSQRNMVILASQDAEGRMWASIVFGPPGFLSAADGRVLAIGLKQAYNQPPDPGWAHLASGRKLGSLIIDLSTRRRLRINGTAELGEDGMLRIAIAEAYPACPKYITRRSIAIGPAPLESGARPPRDPAESIASSIANSVRQADAIFVATQSPEGGFDVSHRGGAAGFLQTPGPHALIWPEYPGNSMYNTLGNLEHDPRTGIVLIDYARNTILQLTGAARTLWDQPDAAVATGGTNRLVQFEASAWLESPLPAGFTTEFHDYSPFNPPPAPRAATPP